MINKKILSSRPLWTLGIAESISTTGSWITMLAIYGFVVFRGEGGVAQSSLIFICGLLPTLLFSPLAGWLCDHYDRKKIMIASELFSGLVVSGLIFTERLEWIYILMILQAISASVMGPARQSVIPSLVAQEDLTQANALLQQVASFVKIFAPMLAGAILAVLNPHQAILFDVLSFLFSALLLSRLPGIPAPVASAAQPAVTNTSPAPMSARGLFNALRGELLGLFHAPLALRLLYSGFFFCTLIMIAFEVLLPIYIRDVLAGAESIYGLLVGMIGIGSLLGASLLLLRKKAANPWIDVLGGLAGASLLPLCMGIGMLLPAAWTLPVLLVSFLIGGIGSGFLNIQASTLLQLHAPAAELGRAGGWMQSSAIAGQVIGLLLIPVLTPAIFPLGSFLFLMSGALLIVINYMGIRLFRMQRSSLPTPILTLEDSHPE